VDRSAVTRLFFHFLLVEPASNIFAAGIHQLIDTEVSARRNSPGTHVDSPGSRSTMG
jgi:hypothetical protein